MNKIIFNILSAAFVTVAVSCNDLDQSPISSISTSDFYRTTSEIETAINGVYDEFTHGGFYGIYNNASVYLDDLGTEYMKAGANTNSAHIREIGNLATTPNNQFMIDMWEWSYVGINRANVVIDKTEASNLTEEEKKRYVGEAKILRAIYYFNLVRWFGGVPVVLHDGEGEGQPRNSEDEVYAQIVSDLEAGTQLPETFAGSTQGRATRYTALGLLSKVYLTWAQNDSPQAISQANSFLQLSINFADEVIASGKFALEEDFLKNWAVNNKNGKESLFQIQHQNNNNVSGHCTFAMGFSNSEPVLILQNGFPAFDRFDARDQRKNGSFAKRLPLPGQAESDGSQKYFTFETPLFRKYIDTINYTMQTPYLAGQNTNTTYLRYAEILLLKAEAENELHGPTAEAYEAFNQVRRRAFRHFPVTDASADDLPAGYTQEQFRWALQRERFNEFVAEGQHWFDLKRWHILVKTLREGGDVSGSLKKTNAGLKNYAYPIPSPQITLNPSLTQNWGYSGEVSGSPYEGVEDQHTSALIGWTSVDSPLIGY